MKEFEWNNVILQHNLFVQHFLFQRTKTSRFFILNYGLMLLIYKETTK